MHVVKLFSVAVFAALQLSAGLPLVFEAGAKPGEYVARLGSSAVTIRSTGVRFDEGISLRMVGVRPGGGRLETRLPGASSYFIGNDREKWRTAEHYERLRFVEVYPGVDVVYYGRDGKLEYDFVAKPYADLSRVLLTLTGARLTASGDLVSGDIRQRRPRVWQSGRELASRYLRAGDAFGVEIEGRDPALAVVIDPVIESSTYLGGGSYEAAKALKIDPQGNLYIAGQAPGPGVFSGPFPSTNTPGADVALIKFSPQSNTIAYYAFLGGDQDDIANSLAIDSSGAAYVTGTTRSANFPVAGGFQNTPGSAAFSDAFVAKITPDGKSIAYSSYLGGTGTDEGHAIVVDAAGAAYVGGSTGSRNFPVQPGAFQSTFGGSILNQSATGFVVVVSAAGNKISYATLLGGGRQEQVTALAFDASGNIYAGGNTSSNDFPMRGGGVQTALPGLVSGFIARLSPDLNQLQYSTYIGGRSTTAVNALAIDAQGGAFAGGYTSSTDFPVQAAPQARYGGGDRDGFLVRLNPEGSDYSFATYLGGADLDTINDLALEANGMVTVAGSTASADFPQRGGVQSKTAGQDAFVAKFLNGTLVFSTLLGGGGDDQAFGVQTDSTGATYVAGVTASADFPVKSTAFQGQFGGGNGDMFLVKLSADASLTSTLPALNVTPTVLSFIAAQGVAAQPAAGAVKVTAVNGAVSFTVDWTGGNWLSANLTRGDAPTTVLVFTNPAGLAIGVYTGTVRVVPTNGTAATIISVTLTVANPAPVLLSVSPGRVPTGSPDTEFTLSGFSFTGNSTIQVALDDGSLSQTLLSTFSTDTTLRFTILKSMMFRDTLLQLRVKDPGSPAVSNTIAIQVGDRFPTIVSVANTASGTGDAVAAGEYVTIAGTTLGPTSSLRVLVGDGAVASSALAGVRVLFDGAATPLLSVADRKVVAVAPWALASKQTTQVVVEYLGVRSNPVTMPVTGAAPAIFTSDGTGTGQALVFNETGLSNATFLPATKGSVVSFYFTGGGVMAPGMGDGKISSSVGSGPVLPVGVTIDGIACELVSVGNALGEVSGMVQASVRVPMGVRSGGTVPLVVTVGGYVSQAGVFVAVN